MTITLTDADSTAAEIAGAGWAAPAPFGSEDPDCGSMPGVPGILLDLFRPLEELLLEVSGDPATLYHTSLDWETSCGHIQTSSDDLEALASTVEADQSGLFAEALAEALRTTSAALHSLADWTKAASQSLQVAMRISEILRALVCDAIRLVAGLAGTVGEVLFGSWPWQIDKKAEVIEEFALEVERAMQSCAEQLDRALQCFRELLRLLTDLFRAIVPIHEEIDAWFGRLAGLIPGGNSVPVDPAQQTGPGGAIYNVDQHPYPTSDLTFSRPYERGYQHRYDLGETDMTQEELMAMLQEDFGHLFLPSRVGDNSQLNMELDGEGQPIETSLFGTKIPGMTSGGIHVQQVSEDGFVIAADEDHPEYPGEVAFRLTRGPDGHAYLEITGAYEQTIFDRHDGGLEWESNPTYAIVSDKAIWEDMSYRFRDRIRYG